MMKINKNLIGQNHTPLQRTKDQIEWIVIHYVGALGGAWAGTEYYRNTYVGASADFFVGHEGEIWQANDYWNYYSWHCGGGWQSSWTKDGGGRYYGICTNANSVGIEMCVRKRSTRTMSAEDRDWYFEPATVSSTVELVRYLMQELDIDIDHVIRHYDVNRKICPNPFVLDYKAWLDFKARIIAEPGDLTKATQLNGMTEEEKIKAMAPLYQEEQRRSGMLASVGLAQFCLESGYGTTDLAQNANNLHGMKCSLSGNTWPGSTWDGVSKYTKWTTEQTASGVAYPVTADFRKYKTMADSIADRSAYFIGAMYRNKPRYPGINTITNAEEQVKAIKDGGYATDVNYVDKLTSLIRQFDLTQYDLQEDTRVQAIIKAAEAMDITVRTEIKAGFPWTYTNKKSCAETFDEACQKGIRWVNCARGVNWVLTLAGIFDAYPGRFYGKKGGSVVYQDAATKDRILAKYDVIKVKTKTVTQCIDDGTIKAGDIVMYMDMNHTNLFLGSGKWFDTGHAYCDGSGEDAPFTAFIGRCVHGAQKVGCILRLKTVIEPSKPVTAAYTYYRVQVGAYSQKANADSRMTEVRDASGYGCFTEQVDGTFKVFCGSFETEANAQDRMEALTKNGIDCFIVGTKI